MATEIKAKKSAAKKSVSDAEQSAPVPAEVAAGPADTRTSMEKRRVVTGTVVSNKMQKTIVVKVDRRVRHDLYKKYVMKSRRFKAHDEKNDAKIGDLVTLVESRPLSRDKRWALQSIVRRAAQALEANV